MVASTVPVRFFALPLQIPTIVSSVTFLAAATSIPDAVSSMAVARKGARERARCQIVRSARCWGGTALLPSGKGKRRGLSVGERPLAIFRERIRSDKVQNVLKATVFRRTGRHGSELLCGLQHFRYSRHLAESMPAISSCGLPQASAHV